MSGPTSWAHYYIIDLQQGKTVQFNPKGNSMTPRIESGQLCTVKPCTLGQLFIGDVVLCKVSGSVYLHLVTAIEKDRVQISNNHGHVNGWTSTIYGKLE